MARVRDSFKSAGALSEGKVAVDISYDIIRHVSAQLYTNPRKAIEELITNSYDAGAKECRVSLPAQPHDPLIVLDNGISMDLEGIKGLWRVAHSPKVTNSNADSPRIANNRLQIGKFGVGKLAAFALGERLTHVTCVDGSVRVISVGQSEIRAKSGNRAPEFDVFKLPLNKAKNALLGLLNDLPRPWEKDWTRWTLAVIEEIDEADSGRALKTGILRRMITTALPISGEFKVYLDGLLVPRQTISPDDIEIQVDVTDSGFRSKLEETLKFFWQQARGEAEADDVPTNLYRVKAQKLRVGSDVTKEAKGILVPGLGPVSGSAILAKTSLTTTKLEERGYSNNGFQVSVHGKLVNPEDELFGITPRSHSYWTKFLARVEIPGLDKALLVQRNAVSENSGEAPIAREFLRSLFNYVRSKSDEIPDDDDYKPGTFGARVRGLSPILGAAALRGLAKGDLPPEGLSAVDVDFATLGQDGPAARFDPATKKILVNQDHPLIIAIDDLGETSKAIRRMIGEVLAGTQMAKGFLEDRGVAQDIVNESSEIMEVALRSAAGFVRDETEEHIKTIEETSTAGDTPFEKAVVTAFRSLRLVAHHLGDSDEPDGTIDIPISGQPNLRISVEAKGSKGVITHKELREATVSRHRQHVGCKAAIAIAREFKADGIGGRKSALVRETEGKIPLITVAGIAKLLRLHKSRPFTYDKIAKILTTWKEPDELEGFIEETWKEVPDIGLMKLVLTVAHDLIQSDEVNLPDPGMILADPRVKGRKIERKEIILVLNAVQIATGMIVIKNSNDFQFEMLAPVDTILEALKREPPMNGDSASAPTRGSERSR